MVDDLRSNFEIKLLELLVLICDTYVARKSEKDIVKSAPGKVTRGTIVSVSSVYENLMATFLHEVLEDYNILVDYPITFPGRNNRVTPDILIMKDNVAKMIIELKIDLGYERADWQGKKEQVLGKLRTHGVGAYQKFDLGTNRKTPDTVLFPETIPYATVILCQKNGKRLIDEVINSIAGGSGTGDEVPYFVLMRDPSTHANDFSSTTEVDRYFENTATRELKHDWGRLHKFLHKYLQLKNEYRFCNSPLDHLQV